SNILCHRTGHPISKRDQPLWRAEAQTGASALRLARGSLSGAQVPARARIARAFIACTLRSARGARHLGAAAIAGIDEISRPQPRQRGVVDGLALALQIGAKGSAAIC